MSRITKFEGVCLDAKANVYFDGKVVSHAFSEANGTRRTLGVIYPGTYHFGTEQAEHMDIIAGSCTVTLDGQDTRSNYGAGDAFDVPAASGFDIEVADGLCEYLCTFLP